MIKKSLFFTVLASLALSHTSMAMPLRAQGVQYDIDAKGAKAVVEQLINQQQLSAIASKIQLGDDDWIALTPKLYAAGNPQMNKAVIDNMKMALVYNPAAVLRTLSQGSELPLAKICQFAKDDAAMQQRAINAINSVRIQSLQTSKQQCLTQLNAPAH